MMKWILLSFSLGWACNLWGLIPIREIPEPIVSFFRSPQSLFPSGTKPISLLKEKKIQTRQEPWYFVEGEKNKGWFPRENLYFFNETSNRYQSQLGLLTKDVTVLRLSQGWRPKGVLPEGTELSLTSIRSDWSCGVDSIGPVCVPTPNLILAIDMASKIKTKKGKWYQVKNRKLNLILTTDNKSIPISIIHEWKTQKQIAFIQKKSSANPSASNFIEPFFPYEKVVLIKKESRLWNQSILGDHGNVWWQEPIIKELDSNSSLLTKEELEIRPIFYSSLSPNLSHYPKFAIVSANGIFFTMDYGESWTHIKQFAESNHPVALGPRNALIVGDQISFNQGKTFQNYIRWDAIAHKSQQVFRQAPQHFLLHSIKSIGSSSILFTVDTGFKILSFEFNTINNHLLYHGIKKL